MKKGAPRTAFQHLIELVKWVDVVVEVLDSRVPVSTRHPKSRSLFGNKPHLLISTKEDIADADRVRQLFEQSPALKDEKCLLVSLKGGDNPQRVIKEFLKMGEPAQKKLAQKGFRPRPVRVCVVGLPNVGKSSLINWLIGKRSARVGNQPGITRGTQWVRVHPQVELLDTPGILPPVAFHPLTYERLAMFNLVPEAKYDYEVVAQKAFETLRDIYPHLLSKISEDLLDPKAGIPEFSLARNLLISGGKPDVARGAQIFLANLRDGKLGRVTFDRLAQEENQVKSEAKDVAQDESL